MHLQLFRLQSTLNQHTNKYLQRSQSHKYVGTIRASRTPQRAVDRLYRQSHNYIFISIPFCPYIDIIWSCRLQTESLLNLHKIIVQMNQNMYDCYAAAAAVCHLFAIFTNGVSASAHTKHSHTVPQTLAYLCLLNYIYLFSGCTKVWVSRASRIRKTHHENIGRTRAGPASCSCEFNSHSTQQI